MRSIASLIDVHLPDIQAPIAGVQVEALAIVVSEAGSLGSMPCALLDTARLEVALRRCQSEGDSLRWLGTPDPNDPSGEDAAGGTPSSRRAPGAGERNAMFGYTRQYASAATAIYHGLQTR